MIIKSHKVENKNYQKILLFFSLLFLIFIFINRGNIIDHITISYNDFVFSLRAKQNISKIEINLKPNDFISLQKERKYLIRNNLSEEFNLYESKIIEDSLTINSQISLEVAISPEE